MKSAKRQAFVAKKAKVGKKKFPILKFLIPLILILVFYLFVKLNTHIWNGKDKVSVVFMEGPDVVVTVLDPMMSEVTTLVIPGDTQVDISRNYGTFRIKNVWQLGINEKVGGSLLTETVTQNFLFPVFLWSEKSPGLGSKNVSDIFRFVFFPGKTNISICDRAHMVLFTLKVQEMGRSVIDLGKSHFLDKKILNDGQVGYVTTGTISQRLTIYFTDNEVGGADLKVNITDETGSPGVAEKLGEILQVVGGKVVSVDKKSVSEDGDCEVSGINKPMVKKIANLFSCKTMTTKTSFDLDIKVGKKFAERF
jgi:hypothetical protein